MRERSECVSVLAISLVVRAPVRTMIRKIRASRYGFIVAEELKKSHAGVDDRHIPPAAALAGIGQGLVG